MNDEVQRDTASTRPALLSKYPALEWLIPALLCTVLLGELFLTGGRLSQAADEATHLYSGYRYLKCGDLTVSSEHPPLAKVVAAAPLLLMNVAVDCAPSKDDGLYQAFAAEKWLYTQDWSAALAAARAASYLFTLGLCAAVWITARRMFGFYAAVVASVLLIFEPNVLAYGSLVLTDVPVTCMLVSAVLMFYLWTETRKAAFFVLAILAVGMTLLSKQSGLVVMPIVAVLAVAGAFVQRNSQKWLLASRDLGAVVLICGLAFLVVWAGYGMRFAPYATTSYVPEQRPPAASAAENVVRGLEDSRVLPLAYLEGFSAALKLSHEGSDVAFVAGKIYPRAPWFSTPFNFAIRSTVASLAMMAAGMFGVILIFRSRARECLYMLIPAGIYLAVCLYASGNVSMRYLMPMLPFVFIAVAAGCVELGKRWQWFGYAVVVLLLFHAASSLHAYPNYFSYANQLWGGPSHAYEYEPWIDAGQGYREARAYLGQHPTQNCWLITAWQWDPALYNLPCQPFGPYLSYQIPARVQGTVIVSSTVLTSVRPSEQQMAAAFRHATPTAYLGGSALLVYEGDFDTSLSAAIGERNLASAAFSSGQIEMAFEHGKTATELAPNSLIAHGDLCLLLAETRTDLALPECYRARSLALQDPLKEEAIRKKYWSAIQDAILRLEARNIRARSSDTTN